MEKIKQKVEHVLGKDHHDTTTTSGTGTHGTTAHGTGNTTHTTGTGMTTGTHGSDPTGPHDSRLANKADPRVDSDRIGGHGNTTSAGYGQHSGVTGTGHTTGTGLTGGTHHSDPTGPHDSRLANKADPRIDSDRIGGHGNTASTGGGYGHGHGHTTHSTGTGLGATHGSDPTGPHDSRLANKADPRVDSDRIGGHGNTTGAGGYGTSHNTGLTGTGTSHVPGGQHSDPSGPHDTRMANKLDPRVDSDQIGNRGNTTSGGYGTGHSTGLTGGTHGTHGDPSGPHPSHLANVADPRVDTDRVGGHGNTMGAGGYGTHNTGTGLTGGSHGAQHSSHLPGPADRTAGPHDSNVMNKMDPRVDSDLDGSKKVGGDRTFG